MVADVPKFQDEGVTWVNQDMDRAKYESEVMIDVRQELSTPETAEEVFVDLWALSSCDVFIGQFSSAFGRLAYEMMAARRRWVGASVCHVDSRAALVDMQQRVGCLLLSHRGPSRH